MAQTDTQKVLRDGILEITRCLTEIDMQRDEIKAILDSMQIKTGVKSKIINKYANAWHSDKLHTIQADNDAFEQLHHAMKTGTNVEAA